MYLTGDIVRIRHNMEMAIEDISNKFGVQKDVIKEMTYYVYDIVEMPVAKLLLLRSRGRSEIFVNAFDYEVEII